MVETRFVCRNVQDVDGTEGRKGKLIDLDVDWDDPVFKVATPAGGVSMIITNDAASSTFIQGNKYRVTFERLPEAQADESGHS